MVDEYRSNSNNSLDDINVVDAQPEVAPLQSSVISPHKEGSAQKPHLITPLAL
jgi:hypothetical protein